MDNNSPASSLRRSEDIALDLLKFLASHSNLKSATPSGTPGFGVPSQARAEDQVTQLLELYARCRQAVEAPAAPGKK